MLFEKKYWIDNIYTYCKKNLLFHSSFVYQQINIFSNYIKFEPKKFSDPEAYSTQI